MFQKKLEKLSKLNDLEERLKGYKKIHKIRNFIEKLLKEYDVEFIILFGSLAKGNWSYRSDIDLLVVSNSIRGDIFQRLYEMQKLSSGGIDIFIYNTEEFDKIFKEYGLIALESLGNGILLYDKGRGRKYMEKFNELLNKGIIKQQKYGWKILNRTDSENTPTVNN